MGANHEELLDAILEAIRTGYAQDVSILMIYGSHVNGTANEKSDLDMIYVPKTQRGWQLARTFLLNGSGNDLWGVEWEHLERYANYDDMKVSVLAESRLVYYATEEDRQRYEALIRRAQDIENGPLTTQLVEKAEEHLKTAKLYYGELCLGDDLTAAGGILYKIMDVISLLNHTYLRFGTKRVVQELSQMKRLPEGFLDAYRATAGVRSTEQAKQACRDLINMAGAFLEGMKREIVPCAVPTDFAGFYEEASTHWNKIRLCRETGNALTALLAATSLQAELTHVQRQLGASYKEWNFINAYNPEDLSGLAGAAQKAEDAFVAFLRQSGVPIREYNTVEQLKNDLLN